MLSDDDDNLSEAVITAVAEAKGIEKTDLKPELYEVVDPDALDALFQQNTGHVEFEYLDYTVNVDYAENVSVSKSDNS